jgi:hypothetical protein
VSPLSHGSNYRYKEPDQTLVLVPFGKYKDQPVELMLADQDYVEHMMTQPGFMAFLQQRHLWLFNIITVGAPKTDDTPEHNQMQVKFLERDFQYAFIEAVLKKSVYAIAKEAAADRATMAALKKAIGHSKQLITSGCTTVRFAQEHLLASISFSLSIRRLRDEHSARFPPTSLARQRFFAQACPPLLLNLPDRPPIFPLSERRLRHRLPWTPRRQFLEVLFHRSYVTHSTHQLERSATDQLVTHWFRIWSESRQEKGLTRSIKRELFTAFKSNAIDSGESLAIASKAWRLATA